MNESVEHGSFKLGSFTRSKSEYPLAEPKRTRAKPRISSADAEHTRGKDREHLIIFAPPNETLNIFGHLAFLLRTKNGVVHAQVCDPYNFIDFGIEF